MNTHKSQIILENLKKHHAIYFKKWISNKTTIQYSLSAFQKTRDLKWVQSYMQKIIQEKACWNQVIVRKLDEKPIGYCGLNNISQTNKSAEYFILIGDQSCWNNGYGTEAGKLILKNAFSLMNLNRVWLTVSELNYGAIKSYQKLGFREEGKMREACFRNGSFHDKIIMSVLKNDKK